MNDVNKTNFMQWDANFTPRYIFYSSMRVLFLSVLIMLLIVEVIFQIDGDSFIGILVKSIGRGDSGLLFAAGFIGLWLFISFAVCWLLFSKGYEASFRVDNKGIAFATRPERRQINKTINRALFWVSLFSGKPGGMGTALLAESSQSGGFEWTDIHNFTACPDQYAVDIKNKWRTLLRVQCTPENYNAVLALITAYHNKYNNSIITTGNNSLSMLQLLAKLMIYLATIIAAFLACQSPLLDNKIGIVGLTVILVIYRLAAGRIRSLFGYMFIIVLIGVSVGMIINAFEPLGDTFVRYYRYERLQSGTHMAEFAVSLLGICLLAFMAWRSSCDKN